MIHILIRDDLCDYAFVQENAVGFEQLRAAVAPFTPDYVAQRAGDPNRWKSPELWIQILGTYGLAVFLVVFYVLNLAPKVTKAWDDHNTLTNKLVGELETLRTSQQALEAQWRQLLIATNGQRWLQGVNQMMGLGVLGLERNKYMMYCAIDDILAESRVRSRADYERDIRAAVMDAINSTRKEWQKFVVPLKDYDFRLGTFFDKEARLLIDKGISEIVEIAMDTQRSTDDRRLSLGSARRPIARPPSSHRMR